jgi:hypothetical protein
VAKSRIELNLGRALVQTVHQQAWIEVTNLGSGIVMLWASAVGDEEINFVGHWPTCADAAINPGLVRGELGTSVRCLLLLRVELFSSVHFCSPLFSSPSPKARTSGRKIQFDPPATLPVPK